MKELILPNDLEKLSSLKVGEEVLLSGVIFTARDAAHKRIEKMIKNGEPTPFDLKDKIIFYAGPAPKKKGAHSAAIGPTTSYRMDPFTPFFLSRGVRGVIGKGKRSDEVVAAIKKYRAVYFIAVGGIAALLSKRIENMELFAFEDLGPEAIYKLKVNKFPLIVAIDSEGNDIYKR